MWITSQRVFFSNAIKRLIHGTGIFNCLVEEKIHVLKKSTTLFDPERLLELPSNSSITPFINVEKINLLKEYCQPQNDVTSTYSFVIDENVAKDIVDNFLASNKRKKRIIAEGNPGLGLITLNLIKSGLSKIFVFDQSEIQNVALTQLISAHPEKIIINSGNMIGNVEGVLLSSLDTARQYGQCNIWGGLPLTLLGVTTSYYFLRGLVISFVKYQLWPDEFEVFLVLSEDVWNGTTTSKYLFKFHIYCVFHILFTKEIVAKYPREAFLPKSKENNGDMYLIRLSLNPNAFVGIKKEELNEYFAFLKILGSSLNNFVIPVLEKWLPDCGPYLISKGISMTTQVRDLSHDEAILLYNFFKECEGYQKFKSLLVF